VPRLLPVLLLLMLVGSPAAAHNVQFQRLVHVRVHADSIEVAMAVVIHAGPKAGLLRERFDRDADGVLSRDEQDAIANWMDSESFRDFGIQIDGDPVALDGRERVLEMTRNHRADLGEGLSYRTVRVGKLVVRPGARQIVVHEAPGNPREMIAVRIDLAPTLSLEGSDGRAGATKLVPAAERAWQGLVSGEAGDFVLDVTVEQAL